MFGASIHSGCGAMVGSYLLGAVSMSDDIFVSDWTMVWIQSWLCNYVDRRTGLRSRAAQILFVKSYRPRQQMFYWVIYSLPGEPIDSGSCFTLKESKALALAKVQTFLSS
jgi:hypothetical protein